MVAYLSVQQVLRLHRDQVTAFGGDSGVRDLGLLESALARPAMTFGGDDLYGDMASKAAAMMHSIVLNHPVVDGNKRVGAHAAIVFLMLNDEHFAATPDELVEITLAVAEGRVEVEALAIWFRQRIVD